MSGAEQKNIRRAVVLGGGGSKGSYEIGVWQAMAEQKIGYHVVTGTSVGALNGALMAMGKLSEAVEMWDRMDNTQVMTDIPALSGEAADRREIYLAFANQVVKNGGVDMAPLEETVRRLVDEDALRAGSVEFGVVTVQYPGFKPVECFLPQIPAGQVADYLLASAACFPAIKPRDIGGTTFIDGGYTNNIPVDLALRATTPVDEVIAVDVEGIGVVRPMKATLPVTILRCYWDLGSILIMDHATILRNIRLGYLDGMKVWGGYGGRAYAFTPGEAARMEERHLDGLSQRCLMVLDAIDSQGRKEINTLVAGRIVNAATHRRLQKNGEIDLRELLLASAELSAELLGLSPTLLYTAQSFEEELLSRYSVSATAATETITGLRDLRKTSLKKLSSGWQREQLLPICCALLHRQFADSESSIPLGLLATLMPREFLAAVYMETILPSL